VSADLVARAHDQGVKVNAWTVDDPDRMLELASFGVDGIVTNLPDLALETLGS
jgi:glycerophosphoryl diester phosphodiesterase